MSDNEKVTIWGGVPRFGTTPAVGQAIAGSGDGFVIYESAIDNQNLTLPANAPPPNQNMEIAKKTVGGVTTKYYGFAGYCASYYSSSTQPNLSSENIVNFNGSSLEYFISLLGSPATKLTAIYPGVYRISGTLDFFGDEFKDASTQTITLSGTAPVSSATGSVSNQTVTISGQTADLSGITAPITFGWFDLALLRFVNVWLKKNGTLVPWAYRNYTLIGDYPRLMVNIDYMIYLNANDYVEIAWKATDIYDVLDPNISLINAFPNSSSALVNMNLVR